jgi:two-component system chemotaxis response regulator CheV
MGHNGGATMSGVIEGVDQRTRLVGRNRLELLLFRLGSRQRFGINVFKVREVIRCPVLTHMPGAHPVVCGVAHIRGRTMPIMDLGVAVGRAPLEDLDNCYVIITEYNRSVQGFLVSGVDRIVNMNWGEILPPPRGTGVASYLTAVTEVDGELVEIIDVEKVLAEVLHTQTELSDSVLAEGRAAGQTGQRILVVDDSSVARNQIRRPLEQLGAHCLLARDGKEALEMLKAMAEQGPVAEQLALVISDIEMPEMDGYTLTAEIRRDDRLKGMYVLLHSSLSGVFNEAMVQKVGADRFIAKYHPDELAHAVLEVLGTRQGVAA